jgi:hypothetical protein
MQVMVRLDGFWGQIAISLRSEAKHPKGGPQARGIWALTPRHPLPAPFPFHLSPFRLSLSKPRAKSGTSMFARTGAAQPPRQATHFLLLCQKKVSKEQAALAAASNFASRKAPAIPPAPGLVKVL